MLGANIHITGGMGGCNNTNLQPDSFYMKDLSSPNDSLQSIYAMQFLF